MKAMYQRPTELLGLWKFKEQSKYWSCQSHDSEKITQHNRDNNITGVGWQPWQKDNDEKLSQECSPEQEKLDDNWLLCGDDKIRGNAEHREHIAQIRGNT